MGQQEVYDFLKKNSKKWWTSQEVASEIEASVGSVTTTLTKLRKRNDVKFKMSKEKSNMFLYMFKS